MAEMNRSQGSLLAYFIHAVRPDWGVKGLIAALGEARCNGDVYDVAVAALSAAQRPENRTPAVIPLPGPHWGHVAVQHKNPNNITPSGSLCGVCSETEERCRRLWGGDHAYESRDTMRARRAPTSKE